MDESNTRLKWNLFYCNLIILVLSSLLSYFFARRTVRPIEEAMEAQKRFTADASHELRTPLTVMRSEIEVALREKNMTLKEAKELLESNLKENEKLESLSNALLKLARYDEGPSKIFKEVSLPQVITRAYEKVETLATKKNIEFQNNLKEASIKGDQDSLAELFVILLDNAIKYSPKGGKIFVDIKRDKKKVIVIVRDRGIGINASHLPHIFDRFYRAESSRSNEKIDGYGLGLAIAKSIVDLHKGKIFAKSTPNKGSEFIVTL